METKQTPIITAGLSLIGFMVSLGTFSAVYSANPGLATIVHPGIFALIAVIFSIVVAIAFLQSMRFVVTMFAVFCLVYICIAPAKKFSNSIKKEGVDATCDKIIHRVINEKVEK